MSTRADYGAAALACMLGLGSGCFDDAPPDGAILLCGSDAECVGGMVCNLARHVCVAPDADTQGPTLTEVSFDPPALASGTAELRLVADEALAAEPAPVVTFVAGSAPLSLTPRGVDGNTWTLLVDADSAPEGAYRIARVTVNDLAGNPVEAEPLDVTLRIDRTPPELFDLTLADAPASGAYSDVEATGTSTTLTMRLRSSEPLDLAATSLRFGAARSAAEGCVLDPTAGSLTWRCSVPIAAAGLVDGDNDAVVEAADLAGNVAAIARAVRADVLAPAIVEGSTTIGIDSNGYDTPVAGLNSRVRFGFVASEDLAADPQAVLRVEGASLPFTVATRAGRRYEMALFIAAPVPAGAWPIEVSLTDAFGHELRGAEAALPTPFEPGVPFVDAGDAVCPAPSALACVDFDGDGSPASAACASGGDLDDTDPLVHPGAYEIPGDGRDNDLVGGDAPLDEGAGIFVNADTGSDANAGTRAAPIQSLGEARARVDGGAIDAIFLSQATATYAAGDLAFDVIIGGLDPLTWQRTGEQSRVSVGAYANFFTYAEGVRVAGPNAVAVNGGTASRVTVADTVLRVNGINLLVELDLQDLDVRPSASGTRLLRSRVHDSTSIFGSLIVDRSEFLEELDVNDTFGRLLATNTRFDSYSAPVDCFGCSHVELHHCTLLSRQSGVALFLSSPGGTARITNSVLMSFSSYALLVNGLDEVVLQDNGMFCSGDVATVDGLDLSIDGLNASPAPLIASGNRYADPDLDLATLLLHQTSPYVGAGGDALAAGAPSTVLADFEGDCRYQDGAPDIGMDEVD